MPADLGGVSGASRATVTALAELVRRAGGMTILFIRAVVALVTPPYSWGREFALQYVFVVKACLGPIVIVQFAFCLSALGIQGGNYLDALGALDRSPAPVPVGLFREFGIFITAAVVAGVAGTSMTAELGARRIRDELDALRVMGVDPIRSMVAPRVLALIAAQIVLLMVTVIVGTLAVYVSATVFFHSPGGPFLSQFYANTSYLDLWASLTKAIIFGVLIGGICCYKGMNVSGGAEGVGRAVNEAVVACLLSIFFVSLVHTQFFLALYPEASVYR